MQTLWAEKIRSTTDVASLNAFSRNEIEVALISWALLRIACLVILYKAPQPMGYQDRYEDSRSTTYLGINIHEVRPLNGLKAMPSEIT